MGARNWEWAMQKEYIKASVVGLADETSLQREPGRDLLELKLGNTARRLSGIAGFLIPPLSVSVTSFSRKKL